MKTLEELALASYDRVVGLESADVAVDCCITKAPCGGEKAGKSPVDRGKRGIKRSTMVDANGIPLGVVFGSGQSSRLPAFGSHPRRSRGAGAAARVGERAPTSTAATLRTSPAGFWRNESQSR